MSTYILGYNSLEQFSTPAPENDTKALNLCIDIIQNNINRGLSGLSFPSVRGVDEGLLRVWDTMQNERAENYKPEGSEDHELPPAPSVLIFNMLSFGIIKGMANCKALPLYQCKYIYIYIYIY